MKNIILPILLALICEICFCQKNIVITGTLKNFYPDNYTGQFGIPFSKRNNKTYTKLFIKPIFQSKDSFYYKFSIDEPGIYTIFFNDIYLIPGDSVHLTYLFEDKNRNLKDSFMNIFSKSGFIGNIGFANSFKKEKNKIRTDIHFLSNKLVKEVTIDSLYSILAMHLKDYESQNRICLKYKKIIKKDLYLERFDSKMKFVSNDSTKLLGLIKKNIYLFNDPSYNTEDYFSALADIPEELYRVYENGDSVLSKLKYYLKGEIFNYASLIFAKILQWKLPSYKDFWSNKIALNVLNSSSDKDLITLANSIINKRNEGDKINRILDDIKIQDYFGNITTIGKILKNATCELKYIDFWASWCSPCIESIPFTKDIAKKVGYGRIEPIIISIDYDKKKWKNSSDRLTIERSRSFCILNKSNFEALDSVINIAPIPHYILIDRNNDIQLLRAPDAKDVSRNFISSFLKKNHQNSSALPPPPAIH